MSARRPNGRRAADRGVRDGAADAAGAGQRGAPARLDHRRSDGDQAGRLHRLRLRQVRLHPPPGHGVARAGLRQRTPAAISSTIRRPPSSRSPKACRPASTASTQRASATSSVGSQSICRRSSSCADRLLPPSDRVTVCAQSALDYSWMDRVDPADGRVHHRRGPADVPAARRGARADHRMRPAVSRRPDDVRSAAGVVRRAGPAAGSRTSLRYRVPPMPFTCRRPRPPTWSTSCPASARCTTCR